MIGKIYLSSDYYNLKCVISSVDKNTYCVRETKRLKDVVDLFARTAVKLKKLLAYLKKNEMDKPPVKRLVENYNPDKIVEILPTSEYTAYAENKGEKIALCATKQRHDGKIIDENTLMFVVLHELAHIMTVTINHTPEFWQNFKDIIIYAKKVKIYEPKDYSVSNVTYCGMNIEHNPYYD
tara:strand:+ start:1037 stop:1576 length:540 start_codon:yes stop_codon:yes gene_type:complete